MIKSILTIVGILAASWVLATDDTQSSKLTVIIKNLKTQEGKVGITLFDSDEKFLEQGLVEKTVKSSATGFVEIVIENLPHGTYAISAMHDQDGDGELDTAVFGIPTEPYGFSNDARGKFGPPSFDDSKFIINGDKTIEINVK